MARRHALNWSLPQRTAVTQTPAPPPALRAPPWLPPALFTPGARQPCSPFAHYPPRCALQGVDLTDEELIDHISEMCVMSKSLEEYEGAGGHCGGPLLLQRWRQAVP